MPVINFEAATNEDWRDAVLITEGANPTALETYASLTMHVRRSADDPGIIIVLSVANTRLVVATGGALAMNVPAAKMAELPPGSYVHDLVGVDGNNVVRRIWSGALVIVGGVTR